MQLAVLVTLSAAGCSSLHSKHPLPASPEPIDREALEGAWIADDNIFHIEFASNGVAQIAWVEWEKDQFRLGRGEMIVTEGGEHNFLSVRLEDGAKTMGDYFFLSYKFTRQGDMVLWGPNMDEFEDMIEKQVLRGSIEKGQQSRKILITNTPEELLEVIDDPDNLRIFDYKEPVVLRKATAGKD